MGRAGLLVGTAGPLLLSHVIPAAVPRVVQEIACSVNRVRTSQCLPPLPQAEHLAWFLWS